MFTRGLIVSLGALLVGCDEEPPAPGPPPRQPCALGGTFMVGTPALLDGSCDEHMPSERDFEVLPTDSPAEFRVRTLGATLAGSTDSDCVLTTLAVTFDRDGFDATLAAVVEVDGDRLAATIDFSLDGLGAGDFCDVRYTVVGQRWLGEGEGNPTGGSCGTGAVCPNELCAYGEVSACELDVCLYQRVDDEAAVFCTEPCEIGSCPAGFVCELVEPWVYRSAEDWFCIIDVPVCGDAEVEGHEVCDDGNQSPGDGCSAACDSDETCANGVWDEAAGEGCDDGNDTEGDGCNTFCALETCGNGITDPGEGCDDGNTINTDSCDGTCQVRAVLGKAQVDASWVRQLPGAELANVVSHDTVLVGSRAVFAWTEAYDGGAGPFGANRETYVSWVGETDAFVRSPVRLATLSGWQLAGLVYRGAGDVAMLLRDGSALALSHSIDGGGSFGVPQPLEIEALPLHTDRDAFATLHGTGDHLYLTVGLELVVVGENRNLFFVHSEDGGLTWSGAVRLSPFPEYLGVAAPPRVHVGSGGELVVVWADGARGAGSIYAARSLDHGVTWLRLNERLGAHASVRRDVTEAALGGSSAGVVATWSGADGVRLARWDGTGSPWLFTTVAHAEALHANLGAVGFATGLSGDVHVAFASADTVWVARSVNGGASFAAPVLLSAVLPGTTLEAVGPVSVIVDRELAASEERVVVLYFAELEVGDERGWTPMAVASDDGGVSWSAVGLPQLSAASSATAKPGDWLMVRVGERELSWTATGEHLWMFDVADIQTAPPPEVPDGLPGVGCPQALTVGGWCRPSTLGAPSPRFDATAVMAGAEMIVFGGHDGFRPLANGGIYEVGGDSWRGLDAGDVPLWPRVGHSAVWTGSEMIVFGGHNGLVPLADGARFDPATDTWTPLTDDGAPAARSEHTAVWTGDEMIVFGGTGANGPLASGARYRPGEDSWVDMVESSDAGVSRHSAVITATNMIVFGGASAGGSMSSRGQRYRLADDVWLPLPSAGTPSARADHSALWTGTEMLVWGGTGRFDLAPGGAAWELAGDAWAPLSTVDQPGERSGHVAVGRTTFNGTSTTITGWIIWGGDTGGTGAVYDIGARGWASMPGANAPPARWHAVAVWAGHPLNRMIVFGGRDVDGAALADGGIFVPSGTN